MHTYQKRIERERGYATALYSVGYWEPHADDRGLFYKWVPLEDTSREDEARALVNYLNGGTGIPFRYAKSRDEMEV